MKLKMIEKGRILIVEDQMISAKGIEGTLKRFGFQVTGIAVDGETALKLVSEDTPDLAIVDIKLKGNKDGIEVAHQIQSQFDVPAVILTAYTDDATVERVYHLGAYGFLVKPFRDEKLIEAIEFALRKHGRKKDVW
jgi:DNA-binding NarL/FixJ family response regulator